MRNADLSGAASAFFLIISSAPKTSPLAVFDERPAYRWAIFLMIAR